MLNIVPNKYVKSHCISEKVAKMVGLTFGIIRYNDYIPCKVSGWVLTSKELYEFSWKKMSDVGRSHAKDLWSCFAVCPLALSNPPIKLNWTPLPSSAMKLTGKIIQKKNIPLVKLRSLRKDPRTNFTFRKKQSHRGRSRGQIERKCVFV